MYVAGMPFMAITAFIVEPIESFAIDLHGLGIWAILYAVVAQSIIGYLLLAFANSRMESSIVSAFGPVNPLSATTAATIILGETVGAQEVIGSIIIIAGLALVTYQRYIEQREADAAAMAASTPEGVTVENPEDDGESSSSSDESSVASSPIGSPLGSPTVEFRETPTTSDSNMVELDEWPSPSTASTPSASPIVTSPPSPITDRHVARLRASMEEPRSSK
jgi:uncharacterized membrane protein